MNTNRGIFESFPSQPANPAESPFEVVREQATAAAVASPFVAAGRLESPFTVVDQASVPRPVEPGRPARVPERRKPESPFQIAEPADGFGFDAPAKAFEAAPAAGTPFPASPQQTFASPFSVEPQRGPSPVTQAAIAAVVNWQESPAAAPVSATVPQLTPAAFAAAPVPTALAPVPQAAGAVNESNSDSFSIRQLELRAIFGVDRELNSEEILQRSRALPGLRQVVRVGSQDMVAVEALKQLLPNLGLGGGVLKLHSESGPLEFIREGAVMLAVQTDGGFAPGVRETLMLVARELDRLS
ncbi:MAG: hypothetical protein V4819_00495 [Verrucomicrobiota bacterium]